MTVLRALYSCGIVLYALALLPKIFSRKYRASFLQRLGKLPPFAPDDHVIWIHAVSMGEVSAAEPLFSLLRKSHPNSQIICSTITDTGQAQAKKLLPGAALYFFLPLDFSWIMRRLVRRLRPQLFILVEGDVWYNQLFYLKQQRVKLAVVSAKLSDRSFQRWKLFPQLAKEVFSLFDILCVQNASFAEKFARLGVPVSKIHVTGNLKWDSRIHKLSAEKMLEWKRALRITSQDRIVVIGSIHPGEEEILLRAIQPLWEQIPHLKILLVPRHPERFAHLKGSGDTPMGAYTKRSDLTGSERIVLIDAMGLLPACYQVAEIAIVGGSFVPGVGGHNIFEPIALGVPTIFGPYMDKQRELQDSVLRSGAGKQESESTLAKAILPLLDPQQRIPYQQACHRLTEQMQGSAQRTGKLCLELLAARQIQAP